MRMRSQLRAGAKAYKYSSWVRGLVSVLTANTDDEKLLTEEPPDPWQCSC
jgi:hypothetical protein